MARVTVEDCIEKISNLKIQILKVSSIYLTDPLENISQPAFYNIIIHIRTIDTLDNFFYNTKNIETDMGKEKEVNVFFRLTSKAILKRLEGRSESEEDTFIKLRRLRDNW